MAIGTAIGALASLIITAYGAYKTELQAQAAQQQYKQEQAQRKTEFGETIGIQRTQLAQQRLRDYEAIREAKRLWKWKEEERDYARTKEVVEKINNTLLEQPAFANNLRNIWRT